MTAVSRPSYATAAWNQSLVFIACGPLVGIVARPPPRTASPEIGRKDRKPGFSIRKMNTRFAFVSSSMLTMSKARPGESWGSMSSFTSASKVNAPSGPATGKGPSTLSFGPKSRTGFASRIGPASPGKAWNETAAPKPGNGAFPAAAPLSNPNSGVGLTPSSLKGGPASSRCQR